MSRARVPSRFLTLLTLVVLPGAMADCEEPPLPFRVTTRKAEDRFDVVLERDRALFTVTSPSGIGGATITRRGQRWPASLVLRLHLHGLERFRIGTEKETLSASVSSAGDHSTSLSRSEAGKPEVPVTRGSRFWTEVAILDAQGKPTREIPLRDGFFEIALPQALVAANPPEITLEWIDFYR